MSLFDRGPVRARNDGTFAIALGANERGVLRTLPGQMRAVLAHQEDPGLRRLFPPAYAAEEDKEHQEEYRRLMNDDLADRHRDALAVLESTAEAETVTREQLEGWMRAINSVRLFLGTRLDVSEDDDLAAEMDASPEYALYAFLGYLQEHVVEALSEGTV